MILNLYDILKQVISESVSPSDVSDAIDNKYRVIINYHDEDSNAPEWRIVEPYVFGKSKSGNDVFRAYQYAGDSWRGKTLGGSHKIPQWRLFRLDRVVNWRPTKEHFNASPDEFNPSAIPYNANGDKSMSEIYTQVKFDYDDNSQNPYMKGSDLYKIRKRTDAKKQSKPINIHDLSKNNAGPISINYNRNLDNDIDMDMVRRNVEFTDKEKKRRGIKVNQTFNTNKPGPVQNVPANNEYPYDTQTKNVSGAIPNDIDMDMVRRNLEFTDKEKKRRGFNIKNVHNNKS